MKKRNVYYVYRYMYTSSFLEKSYGSTSSPTAVPSARLEGIVIYLLVIILKR
ncbi:hypothetical protein [Lysinibacillus sphaericus]|uniref:hypothetical protein n=1 Tax=Lysinibacillus sphaericus TaxID=1421 RepID=UPI0020A513F0|nr:hypothetical protein [Lysinibacillus sphaericus]